MGVVAIFMEVVLGLYTFILPWSLFTNLIFGIDVFLLSATHVAIRILFRCFLAMRFQIKIMVTPGDSTPKNPRSLYDTWFSKSRTVPMHHSLSTSKNSSPLVVPELVQISKNFRDKVVCYVLPGSSVYRRLVKNILQTGR